MEQTVAREQAVGNQRVQMRVEVIADCRFTIDDLDLWSWIKTH